MSCPHEAHIPKPHLQTNLHSLEHSVSASFKGFIYCGHILWSGTGHLGLRPFSSWALQCLPKSPNWGHSSSGEAAAGSAPTGRPPGSSFPGSSPSSVTPTLPISHPGSQRTGSQRGRLTQAGPTRYSPPCLQLGWRGQ